MKHLKIPTERGSYYCKAWLEVYDGGSGQWLYVCRDSLAYIFICIDDMVEACGKDAQNWFNASVCVVDLLSISPQTVASCLRSIGYDEELDFKKEHDRLIIAEACFSAGAKSPLWQDEALEVKDPWASPDERHPEFRKLRAAARRFAEEKLFDETTRNHLLDTVIVNKIGQTARSFADGIDGLWSALRDIKQQGDAASPEQQLVLRMYRNAGQTLGAGPVPQDLMEEP